MELRTYKSPPHTQTQYFKQNHSNNTTISHPEPLKTTMFQFRTGFTPKKSKGKLNILLDQNWGSETQTLPTTHHLSFQTKEKCKSPKLQLKINIPTLGTEGQRRDSRGEGEISQFSSSENIQMKHEYIKLFQEDLLNVQGNIPEEVTFRNKARISSDKMEDRREGQVECSRSPHAIESKKKVSIQFAPKSPKYSAVKESAESKLQKTLSTFDFHPSASASERQIKELKDKVRHLESLRHKEEQCLEREKIEYMKREQQLMVEVSVLSNTVSELESRLALKEEQLQHKSNILMEEINQLIKDRHIVQRKLGNVISPLDLEGDQDKILSQLQQRLNAKETEIQSLEQSNNELFKQVNTLQFQISNLKSRAIDYQTINISSQLSVFQQALKYSIQEIARYKSRIEQKDEEIDRIRQIYGLSKGETQRTRNQLSIEQLKRITEIQTLRTTFEAERVSKNNQITDLTQEVNSLKNKVRSLNTQVKEKDNFILSKIKVIEK